MAAPTTDASKPAPLPATSLALDDLATLDRVIALAHGSRGVETIELKLPETIPGLPSRLAALVKHTDRGPLLESVRPLFEAFATAPERRKGLAATSTLDSFIALVDRHKDAASSVVFAKTTWPSPRLEAVIDYHTTDHAARFAQHRIEYVFPLTEEFSAWMAHDGKAMAQADFALFLEEHVDELASPYDQEKATYEGLFKEKIATPSEIMALSRDLEIHVGQKVKRKERLQSGERSIVFESEHTTASGEAVDIPGIFMISVAAFVDGEPIRIPARLRYRVGGGDLVWFYQLYRPGFWLRAQVQNDLARGAAETGLPTFEGAPEK